MPEEKREKRGGSLIVPTKDEGKKPSSAMISPRKNQVTIKSADMKEEVQKEAIDCAIAAFEKHSVEKDIAAYIKKGFDNKYGPTWHCIVGRNFELKMKVYCCQTFLHVKRPPVAIKTVFYS
ncbi:hypothetical protein AMTR_s00045p00194200 [Amborella trichopoda]|uniref:Dynein light chain n=1 Tax=Amborella trichopoda TaxID=13333 RepID=W1P3H8_AMBTC|nr:hypothetical protein AMTR_s00045p00194200 [Amborella trichopoda]